MGDHVIFRSDDSTPNQRFWVALVMNATTCNVEPHVDDPDPDPVDGAPRWLKVWWLESDREYGRYKKQYHRVGPNSYRVQTLSWETEDSVISKLVGGLNQDGSIKAYTSVRTQLEYDIKSFLGDLDGDEELEFEKYNDDVSEVKASRLIGQPITKNNLGGMILGYIMPDHDDNDQRIKFDIMWYGGSRETVVMETLEGILVYE